MGHLNITELFLSFLYFDYVIYIFHHFWIKDFFAFQITNQMIETCKQYITCRGQETIWTQDRNEIRQKLYDCIRLNKFYHNTYTLIKNQPFIPNQSRFGFSENYVFGKFDAFCDRLSKIISMFDLVDDYHSLFERRMEGSIFLLIRWCFMCPSIIMEILYFSLTLLLPYLSVVTFLCQDFRLGLKLALKS